MEKGAPEISLIILNYQSRGLSRECIRNFSRLDTSLSTEIIVVDNGGERALARVIEERFPHVRYVKIARNIGFAAGNNVGAGVARGRYLAFVNQDIMPTHGSLDALHVFMERNEDVAVCGPALQNPDGSRQQSYFRFYRPFTPLFRRTFLGHLGAGRRHVEYFLMRDVDPANVQDVDFLMGAFLFARRRAIDDVGLLDERFFFYFEDTDWCKRFWSAGWRVCCVPESVMVHLHSRSSAQRMGIRSLFDRATQIHVQSGIRYFFKHWPSYAR